MGKWVPVQSADEPTRKTKKTETRFVPVAVTREGRRVPLRVAPLAKSSKGEKRFRMTKPDPKRQAQLEADLRKSREEVGRDLGGGVGAVLFDLGDGRERRLDGLEAGDTLAKGEDEDEGESYGRSIFGQKPTKTTRDLGYERRR